MILHNEWRSTMGASLGHGNGQPILSGNFKDAG
jgi:hypothetical protein